MYLQAVIKGEWTRFSHLKWKGHYVRPRSPVHKSLLLWHGGWQIPLLSSWGTSGGELCKRLREEQQFPEPWGKFYSASVLFAFCHMHAKKIAYRDLKPENLVMDSIGYVKVVDFGLAKVRLLKCVMLPNHFPPNCTTLHFIGDWWGQNLDFVWYSCVSSSWDCVEWWSWLGSRLLGTWGLPIWNDIRKGTLCG